MHITTRVTICLAVVVITSSVTLAAGLDAKTAAAQYDSGLAELEKQSKGVSTPCARAILVAVKDSGVRKTFIKKVLEGHIFEGVSCLNNPRIPGVQEVLFDFACKPGTICLIPPAFLAVVDTRQNKVVKIVDPYIPHLSSKLRKADIDVDLSVDGERRGDEFCVWGTISVKIKVWGRTVFSASGDTPTLCVSTDRPHVSSEFSLGGVTVKAEGKLEGVSKACLKVSGKAAGFEFDSGWRCKDLN